MTITNCELRITSLKARLQIFAVLCAVYIFLAGVFFAQEVVLTQAQIDWLATSNFLSRMIADGTTEQKRDALIQIRNLKTAEASQMAIRALKDSSEIVRATAAASVVFLPADEAVQSLVPLLADKKPLVRREVAYALGVVGNANSVNPLLRVMQKDKVMEVRNAAVVALGEIGDVSAVSELVKLLQRKPQSKEEFTRRSAARSIGQIAQIIQTGKREIITPRSFSPEQSKRIEQPRYAKLNEAFPQFQLPVNVLIRVLGNQQEAPDVRREAAFALGAIGDESAIPILRQNVNNADYYLAEICRESLRKIAAAIDP